MIRAGWSQRMLEAIERLDRGQAAKIVGRIPDEARTEIEGAARLAWIPIRLHVAMLEAVVAELGPEADAFFARSSQSNMSDSMLRSILTSTFRLFGIGPRALIRMFPRGFGMLTRGCGRVEVRPTPHNDGTEALFESVPEELRTPLWVAAMRSVFVAIFAVANLEGTVTADDSQLDQGCIRYVLRAHDRETLFADEIG